ELIKLLNLSAEFAQQLDPYVRDKYAELWKQGKKRYIMLWRKKWLTAESKTIDGMIQALRVAADELEAMRNDGVTLDSEAGGIDDDYVRLTTTDPELAKKYDMVEESEYWGGAEEDDGDQD
ncbi:MAG TPA: hypothetical protein VHC19_20850, partial [Pirellulales bacterium]|nr:hypothetical protein [Pirellulales bacterium]